MGRIPTRPRSEERSRKHKLLHPIPSPRRSRAKVRAVRVRKPGSMVSAMSQTRQRLAVAQTKELEPRRREIAPESRATAEEDSWMSWISVSPTHASPLQDPTSPLLLPDCSTLTIPKQHSMSPSPWARSWFLYHRNQAQRTGQRSDHKTVIDSRLGKAPTLQPPKVEQTWQATLFDVEWEAFQNDCDYQDPEPGWPGCPYCGTGHDPCLPCFA